MAVVLCRIDDRLIHGQVVIGWGRPLGVSLIVLVDDQVAASPWEQDLYRMAVPPDIRVEFATLQDAAVHLPEWASDSHRVAVLTGDIPTMVALHDARADLVQHVNLGGIHHRPGRVERLRYVYLTEEELMQLRRLEASGAKVSAQDLPTAAAVPLEALG
jgi:PTS system mannose-specific IIB component/fructoselysine and glucoselysine-specific PTS system IIB component